MSRRLPLLALLGIAFAFVVVSLASVATQADTLLFRSNVAALQSQQVVAPVTDIEQTFANIYSTVSPSVVSINVVARVAGSSQSFIPEDEFFSEGTGTGFVIDQSGHIVTNNHVVEGATRIEVNFFDGTIARGEVVGLDPDSDIAVVRVDLPSEALQPVQFADSDGLFVGQQVVALGSPFGQRWTMTTGIVSAVDRTIRGLGSFQIGSVIQTDAAINPGNSGGPLLDLAGRVVGVNSQIISRTRSSSGIGFAVPSNLVQRVAQSIISTGTVNYSYLGISSRPNDVDLALIEAMNLPNNTRGVVVLGVEPGGPAANAGLRNAGSITTIDGFEVPRQADIIVGVDNQPVTGFNDLISYLASNTVPGQTVTLSVLRDGQNVQVQVTLGERPRIGQ